jgi:penicillin-binding protein 1C
MIVLFYRQKKIVMIPLFVLTLIAGAFIWKTGTDLLPLPEALTLNASDIRKIQVLDRHHIPLTVTYQNRWNVHDCVPLHAIPDFLQQAFVISEDQRFYRHRGVDWIARWHALFQNLKALRPVRGASTISEQVIRMRHPRPRTLWSRWLEGVEAGRLENTFLKAEILEFYLNQVPYTGQRRGVVQAARYYFDRDLETLSHQEMLALVVMVRAPAHLDLRRDAEILHNPMVQLAGRLLKRGIIDKGEYARICSDDIRTRTAELPVEARHFVQHIYQSITPFYLQIKGRLRTTLDAALQYKVQTILNERLFDLKKRGAGNGAVLVVDHQVDEVLAWVNGNSVADDQPSGWIDAVTTPRQPGSTLKPFLYATALEKGWTAATILEDRPLAEPVGRGLHAYHNYSRTHYGAVRVRDALGNSLNIPAVLAIQFVGVDNFLQNLHNLGICSLQQHPHFYGDGLALGNGEITLLELIQAYAVLARQGIYRPLKLRMDDDLNSESIRQVFSPEVASIIANILSDPNARRFEFGTGSLLRFPVQTAVKTGTSSDYRDAWAVGFNHRFTVGVWIGNLDHQATDGITGSTGPALVLRAVFTELNRHQPTRPLYLSPRLVQKEICRDTGQAADGDCPSIGEWFVPGTEPNVDGIRKNDLKAIHMVQPTNGLLLAMDPRLPDDQEAFVFVLGGIPEGAAVDWFVDDRPAGTTATGRFVWPLQRGKHMVRARIQPAEAAQAVETSSVSFRVK